MYLKFARSPAALWSANFRDLNNSIARMLVLAEGNRIGEDEVRLETARLQRDWSQASPEAEDIVADLLGQHALAQLDLFDRYQLAGVIEVCRKSDSLAAAGRTLFASSLRRKKSSNDSDRLRKYLQRFNLDWETLKS